MKGMQKRTSVGLILVGLSVGCGDADVDGFRQREQLATTYTDYTASDYWASGETVSICFTTTSDPTFDIGVTERDVLWTAIAEQTWGSLIPNNLGWCPGTIPTDYVSVFVNLDAPATSPRGKGKGRNPQGRQGGIGARLPVPDDDGREDYWDARTDIQIWVSYWPGDIPRSRQLMLHELAHALGLQHEHRRQDISPCGAEPQAVTTLLTVPDPVSISNYCNLANGRAADDYHLSRLDELGFEILYPHATDLPISCGNGCFETSEGPLIRSTGQLVDNWTHRGALPWWPEGEEPVWRRGGIVVGVGASLLGDALSQGSNGVAYSGEVQYSDENILGTGTVVKSDAVWTALASSLL